MTASLRIIKTPNPLTDEYSFGTRIRDAIRDKFNVPSAKITIDPNAETIAFIEGLCAGLDQDSKNRQDLEIILEILEEGDSIDMWMVY